VSDEHIDRTDVDSATAPTGSCLVVTRPQRRQAPGHGDRPGFAKPVAVTFISNEGFSKISLLTPTASAEPPFSDPNVPGPIRPRAGHVCDCFDA
jgi:hypothetical protein